MLVPPPIFHQNSVIDPNDIKVSQWIRADYEEADIGIIGVPLSRSSISASGASESPLAIRQTWRSFTPYDIDNDIDFSKLKIKDFGDIRMYTTDILKCHNNIKEAMSDFYTKKPDTFPFLLGGDHSITAPSVKALVEQQPNKKIGIIQFDTHLDVRNMESGGPSNGTPIRNLIESEYIEGNNIFQIGLHNFANSKPYTDYAKAKGINFYTMKQVRSLGLEAILSIIQSKLASVDYIYLTIDIDVLDQAMLPGSPGSAPGGMCSWDLFDACNTLARNEKIVAADMVCLDPMRDLGNISVRTATSIMLSFFSGFSLRHKNR